MSKIPLLQERIKKLETLSAQIDKDIEIKKAEGYKDAPKYLLDLKKEVEEQKAVCEQEKKIFEEGEVLIAIINKPGTPKKDVVAAKARVDEIRVELKKLATDNSSLHNTTTAQGVADPCIPCLIKKATQQNPAKHFVKFNVVGEDGKPIKRVAFQVELPDGNTKDIMSDGTIATIPNIEPGNCKIELKWHSDVTVYDALILS